MSEIKKFLFLNQMAGPLFRELSEDLSKVMPDQCTLLTGHPDTLALERTQENLTILAAPIYNRSSKYLRVLSWLHYSVIAFWHMLKADKSTAFFIVSNPPFLGFIAWLTHAIKGTKYIVLVYDIHPETLVSFGVLKEQSFLTKTWRSMNRRVWNQASAVYTLGNVMADKLSSQFSPENTQLDVVGVIPPWADTETIKPIDKNKNPLAKKMLQENVVTVLYSGNMGISHDIESMLQAANILAGRKDIQFVFIGEGAKWQTAVNFVEQHDLKNVQVLPFQPEEVLPFTMALGDISLVALDKGAEGLMIPSKMFYYMAAGSAIIGICQGENDLAETLNSNMCGIVIEPGKPDLIAEAIINLVRDKKLLQRLSINSRKAAVTKFSREVCMSEMLVSLKTSKII